MVATEQGTTAGSAAGVVEMGVLGVVAALKPYGQDGEDGEADYEDDDHDNPLVVSGPPRRR